MCTVPSTSYLVMVAWGTLLLSHLHMQNPKCVLSCASNQDSLLPPSSALNFAQVPVWWPAANLGIQTKAVRSLGNKTELCLYMYGKTVNQCNFYFLRLQYYPLIYTPMQFHWSPHLVRVGELVMPCFHQSTSCWMLCLVPEKPASPFCL